MAKDRKSIITDTGAVEYLPTDEGKMAYAVTWPPDVERPTRGRPVKQDWQGVLRWLVAEVAKKGLPTGAGAQATVEGWIRGQFLDNNFDVSDTLIKEQVRKIYKIYKEDPPQGR